MTAALEQSLAAYDTYAEVYTTWTAGQAMTAQLDRFAQMIPAGGRVLDAGCGAGRDLSAIAGAGYRPFGTDRAGGLLAKAAEVGAPLTRADLRSLPYPEACFDGVWSCASLVHLDRTAAGDTLGEFARVLGAGGGFYATVKAGEDTGSWGDRVIGGRRWFFYWRQTTFTCLVEAAGFDIVDLDEQSPMWVGVYAHRRSR